MGSSLLGLVTRLGIVAAFREKSSYGSYAHGMAHGSKFRCQPESVLGRRTQRTLGMAAGHRIGQMFEIDSQL